MKLQTKIHIPLNTTPEEAKRLNELQATFANACNLLMSVVQQTRIWNRVALHHLAYKSVRETYPSLGSQMACNAIYSVSRTCRILFQSAASPFNVYAKLGQPLPQIQFSKDSPVYFDRHTLSIKKGQLSIFTLDGRLHFQLILQPTYEKQFHELKLKDIILQKTALSTYELIFSFAVPTEDESHYRDTSPLSMPEHIFVLDPQ